MARTKKLECYVNEIHRSIAPGFSYYGYNSGHYVGSEVENGFVETYVVSNYPKPAFVSGISSTATIQEIILEVDVRSSGGTHSVCGSPLSASVADGGENQANFNTINSVSALWVLETGARHTVRVTDADQIAQIMQYGVGFRAYTGGTWKAAMYIDMYYTYTDPYEPPEIAITSAPLTAYLSDTVALAWSYLQASDAEQYAIDVEITDAAGKTVTAASKYVTSANNYAVLLSALNIAAGAAAIRVRAYIQSGSIVGEWAEVPAVTLRNIAVVIVSPKGGENKLASQSVLLRWRKAADDTSVNDPYGFTVQYSTNAGESWTNVLTKGTTVKESGVWYVEIPANTFPHGIVQWRVMTWTTQYQAAEYVKDSFAAVIQASTSAVTCDGKPLPTLSWTSTSQAAYQVRFADYDSGAVYGNATSHTVPYVYADGLYAVQVRTQATTGEWSAWTETQYVQITNAAPSGSVSLSAQKTRHTVTLSWTASGTFAGYILYRGGVPICAGAEMRFADIAANGENTYFVRAVTSDGYYVQSESVTVDATPATDCIYDYAGARWISLKYSAIPRRRQYTQNKRVSYRYYAGRKYPIVFTEGFRERIGSFSYCFRDRAEAGAIEALSGGVVYYKGMDGSSIYGILNSVSNVTEILRDISFTITEIDREERVPYETQ